jgi:hypothetical protein
VEENFGRPITTSRDCILLSEEIFGKTSFKINHNTLRRSFGLVKATYPPSSGTQMILLKYCGFDSLEELDHTRQKREKTSQVDKSVDILDYFVSIFRATQVKNSHDQTFLSLVKQTILFLQKHPDLKDKFQREIAKTKNGQDFYFEQFVNIDRLNSFYGEGLRYYLKEKKTPEAHIFAHALLCQRGWLSDNAATVKKHFEEVYKKRLTKSIHPFVCGRHFASHLFFASINGLPSDKVLQDAHLMHAGLKPPEDHYHLFPCFEYTFSIALVLTGHYAEALFYLDHAFKHYPESHSYMEEGFFETLQLLKALALAKTGHRDEAKKIYTSLKPSRFYFLTKKTNTILYIQLGRHLNKTNPKLEAQLEQLVEETGFVRLRRI